MIEVMLYTMTWWRLTTMQYDEQEMDEWNKAADSDIRNRV